MRAEFKKTVRARMGALLAAAPCAASHADRLSRALGVWEAIEKLNTLVDDSDPDVRIAR